MSVSINSICRKDRINQNRTTNIYLRFTVNRRSRYVSTGINIPAADWDFDTQTLKTQNPAVQLRIYEQIEKYDKRIKRLEALEVPVTLDNVLETDGRRVYCTIAEYFRRTIAQLESVGKVGSASKHKVTLSLLQQFRSTNIRFDEITVGCLRDFELFLMKKGNKSNSIATKFSVLKAVYNKALAEGIFTTPHSPFLQFKIGRLWTATRKRAIRKEEVQRLMQAEIPADGSAYLDFARDIFLFSYTMSDIAWPRSQRRSVPCNRGRCAGKCAVCRNSETLYPGCWSLSQETNTRHGQQWRSRTTGRVCTASRPTVRKQPCSRLYHTGGCTCCRRAPCG